MLKLYKATILISAGIGACALGLGMLCEWLYIPHGTFLQNLAIGLFCSLLVVVITSVLQYKYVRKDMVREYSRALWKLVSGIGEAYRVGNCNFSDEFYRCLVEKIDHAFDKFNLYADELVWFSLKKQKFTKMISFYKKQMEKNYIRNMLKSDKEAVLCFSGNTDYIDMIDYSIMLFYGSKIGDILQIEKDYNLKENR